MLGVSILEPVSPPYPSKYSHVRGIAGSISSPAPYLSAYSSLYEQLVISFVLVVSSLGTVVSVVEGKIMTDCKERYAVLYRMQIYNSQYLLPTHFFF